MKVFFGVQARTNSSRFPGKIYETIGEKSVLEWAYSSAYEAHRLLNAQKIQSVPMIIGPASDETLKEFCKRNGLNATFPLCAEDDLIKRYKLAAEEVDATHVVRITSDCWQLHPRLIAEVVALLLQHDYVSNAIRRTFIEGWDIQGCSREALKWVDAYQIEQREHPFLDLDMNLKTRQQFQKAGYKWTELLNPQLGYLVKGTSIDTRDDLERARIFYAENQKTHG